MTRHRCRVLLVDDHGLMREALRALLGSYEDVEVIAEARDGEEAIISVASCQPEIILMDINMPRMNGIEATAIIKKSRKEAAIIGLCMIHDTYAIEAFLKAGALAVVSKDRLDDLHSTIRRACAQRRYLPSVWNRATEQS
jgi:DNA-binding NarL/FixJ family response regulator